MRYAARLALAVVVAAAAVSCSLNMARFGGAAGRVPGPWWDDYPLIVQTGSVGTARDFHATAVLCGAADDPAWGLYGQSIRLVKGKWAIGNFHNSGMKTMAWLETYGTTGCYIAKLQKKPDGSWEKYEDAPTVTRTLLNQWAWQYYDGTGEVRWIGAHNYFCGDDFAAPYTRTHPRYGCPPMTYPDGKEAAGYNGSPDDPRNSRIFDAGAAKDVLGRVSFDYSFNAAVNEADPKTGKPKGPITGLVHAGEKYSGDVSAGKDSACPIWTNYVKASALHALDAGTDGFWCDNYSPWDSFGSAPVQKAFGEWSVAGFRRYLAQQFPPAVLSKMGVGDAKTFDVRECLRKKCVAFGGNPEDRKSKAWKDPRWLDDPVWRAYMIYKRQTGTAALSRFYAAIKDAARTAGKPEPLVAGNDIPIFSLGWPRGDLDMVSTELSWGWGLTTGERGLMPPPKGSFAPVYKLAREHAKGRFVNVWMYMPKEQLHKPNITRVLFYQGLANHALPMPQPGGKKTAGDDEVNAELFDFARSAKGVMGGRTPVEEIGVYYSSSSQLAGMCPGGAPDFNDQPHIFAYWGWGTALSRLHYTYRAVPEWKLSPEALSGLRVLIVPEAEVFDPDDVPTLTAWVRGGGLLIVTGQSGRRRGESGNFGVNEEGLALAPLTGVAQMEKASSRLLTPVGRGKVLYLREDIGRAFYKADAERAKMLPAFREALAAVSDKARPFALCGLGETPATVELSVYSDASTRRVFVDVNNVDIDTSNDTVTPTPPLSIDVRLPSWLQGRKLSMHVLSPEGRMFVLVSPVSAEVAGIRLSPIQFYASVLIEEERRR